MTPIQILLNNFLYDLSQTAIPTDTIDAEYLKQPRPWNVAYIKKFITYIGPISSIFDFVTFGVLYLIMKAPEDLFHTGWFLESLITQTLVIHIIRTNKIPFIESKPSKYLVITSLAIVMLGIIIPYLPLAEEIGFVHPPAIFFVYLTIIVILYLLLVNFVKKWFVKKYGYE
jgi:Mg2+-importing ATPase